MSYACDDFKTPILIHSSLEDNGILVKFCTLAAWPSKNHEKRQQKMINNIYQTTYVQ